MTKVWWIAVLMLIAISGSVTAQDMPSKDQLPPGQWNQISPGGATICGHGAPYSFYYREGSGQNLLIDFQGGGMCWNGQTCSPTADKTFDDNINPGDPSDNPALFPVGITDFSNPENPFINDDMVFVDYCTGDFHTGNNDQGYTYNDTYFDVKHNGYVNASTVLNWVYANIPVPDSVFVTGCSAGSVGAAYWSADIKAHYPSKSRDPAGRFGRRLARHPRRYLEFVGIELSGRDGREPEHPQVLYRRSPRRGTRRRIQQRQRRNPELLQLRRLQRRPLPGCAARQPARHHARARATSAPTLKAAASTASSRAPSSTPTRPTASACAIGSPTSRQEHPSTT